jgi:hypothetical protein
MIETAPMRAWQLVAAYMVGSVVRALGAVRTSSM